MKRLALKVRCFLKSAAGPTAVEYAVLLALVVTVCLATIKILGTTTSTAFNNAATSMSS